MAKVKEDISRVRLFVDGKQGINELGKLEMQAKELKVDLKHAKRNTDEYINTNKKLNKVNNRIKEVRQQLGITGMTMGQLIRYQKELNREIVHGTTSGTQRYKELKAELTQVNAVLRNQRAELNGTKGFFAGLGKEIKQFGLLALGYLGANALFSQVQSLIDGSAKLSDELADVQKTTGLTDIQMEKLSQTLNSMNTRTPRGELRGLAEIAGRLGIQGTKDIEGFVSAADKINVALGDALGDPEKVMRELGKLTETFGVRQEFGIEGALLKVGSAINELGMASTANEGYLVEFSKRLGGIAPLAGISIENVLGLGATLDSLGQTSEVSTTALSKLFIDMAKNAEKYARFAKMEVSDFVKLMNEDANEAFVRMLEGVKDNSGGITELAATLGDLGQDGGRVVGVLGTLANNTERLREQQRIANDAFREGTSVVNEFNLKNENMAANLAKVQKWLAGFFVNSTVMQGLNSFVGLWARWIEIPISDKMEAERIELNKLYLQITSTNTSAEERIRLINQLKETYPGYLSNIEADKVSNEELSRAVKEVNQQLVNKIILQEQDERIQTQYRKIADVKMQMIKAEDKLLAELIKISEKYNIQLKENVSLEEQAVHVFEQSQKFDKAREGARGQLIGTTANLNQALTDYRYSQEAVNSLEEKGNILLEERNKLIERLGINLGENQGSASGFGPVDPDDPDPDPTVPDNSNLNVSLEAALKAWEDYLGKVNKISRDFELNQMESEQRDLERTRDRFAELENELASHLEKKAITQEEFSIREKELEDLKQQELDAIKKTYSEKEAEERKEAQKKILEEIQKTEDLNLDEQHQRAKQKVDAHFDSLLQLARQFGLDEVEIHAAKERAITALEKEQSIEKLKIAEREYEMKKQMVMTFANSAISFLGMVNSFSKDSGEFEKVMAIGNAAVKSGEAIANIIAAFSSKSITPIDLAVRIAGGIGVISANIATAVRSINRASFPDPPAEPNVSAQPDRGRISTPPRTSFYFGGPTSGGLGFGDQYGEFAGFVHKKEYVVPTIVAEDPWVANLLPAIESIRQDRIRGFAQGGQTSSGPLSVPQSMGSDPEVKELLRMMVKKLDMMPKQVRAYLVYNDLEEMQEEMDTLKSRYTA